jgi:ribosomal protein L22
MTISFVEINCEIRNKKLKNTQKILTHLKHQNQLVRTTNNWLLSSLIFSPIKEGTQNSKVKLK